MLMALLNIYTAIAVIIFAVGLSLHLGRWLAAATIRRRYRGITRDFEGGPQPMGLFDAVKTVLYDPVKHFYRRANPTWSRGYMLYHIAIVIKAAGYGVAAVFLVFHIAMNNPVPDIATHTEASYNYAPGNLAAIVFGSGEPLQAHFLFGEVLGTGFVYLTAAALVLAVVGNLHMLYTVLRNRGASAIIHDIDQAARGIRSQGTPKWDRVAVRLIIFAIIWADILARLHIADWMIYFHSALGMTMLLMFPFTYLFHMIYNVIALAYSTRRRMARTVA